MDRKELKELLKELVAIPGIPAHEKEVRDYVMDKIKGTRANIEVNNLGCVIATFEGKEKNNGSVLIDAHMDEVGYIVQYIEKNGFLRIVNFGNIDARVTPNQRLEVHSFSGKKYPGVVGLLPPHVLGAKDVTVLPLEQLSLDCGFTTDEDVKKAGIRVGSQVTFIHDFRELENGRFSSKAIDDRVGCAALIALAQYLDKDKTDRTITLSFSVQEEGGLRGISTVVERIRPEYALVVESTTACDMAGVSDAKQVTRLGNGVAFTVTDNYIFLAPEMLELLIEIAENNKIKYQLKTPKYGGTNAGNLHNAAEGVKTGIVAVPARYLHSPVSVAQWDDFFGLFDFVKAYVHSI